MTEEGIKEEPFKYKAFSSNAHREDDYMRWSLLSQAEKSRNKTGTNLKSTTSGLLKEELKQFNPAPKKVNGTFIAPKDPKAAEQSSLFRHGSHSLTEMLNASRKKPERAPNKAHSGRITFNAMTAAGEKPLSPADLLAKVQGNRPTEEKSPSESALSFFAQVQQQDLPAQPKKTEAQGEPAASSSSSLFSAETQSGVTKTAPDSKEDGITPGRSVLAEELPASLLTESQQDHRVASEPTETSPKPVALNDNHGAAPLSAAAKPEDLFGNASQSTHGKPPFTQAATPVFFEENREQSAPEARPTIAELIEQRRGRQKNRHLSTSPYNKDSSSLKSVINQGTLKSSIDTRRQHNLASTEGVVFREFAQGPVLRELKGMKQQSAYQGFEFNAPKVVRTSAAETEQEQRALQVKQKLSTRGILSDLKQKVTSKIGLSPAAPMPAPTPMPAPAAVPAPAPAAFDGYSQPLAAHQPETDAYHQDGQKYAALFNQKCYSSRRELRSEQRLSDIFKRIESCQ